MALVAQATTHSPADTILTKRNAMKARESSYGTFSSSDIRSQESSFASTSKVALEDIDNEGTALLKAGASAQPEEPKLWKVIVQKLNPSLRLENIGSVARDHLASERTFLAYVRTSLAISMTGVVLGQMFLLSAEYIHRDGKKSESYREVARPIAVFTILSGIFVLLTGAVRYFLTQSTLLEGDFSPAIKSVWIISLLLITVIIFAFFIIVTNALYSG